MFTLWNSGGSGEDLVATFTWNGVSGQYKLPVHLEAGASLVIDLAQLIAANRPDSDGNVIPVSAREGSAMFASTAGPHETINLVVSGGEYNVETATCCPPCICCYGVTAYVVSPSSATLPYGNTLQLSAAAYYNDGTSSNVTNYTTWSSGNTSVATISSGGLVSGAGVGSTSVTGRYVDYGAPPPCSGGPCISQTFQSSSNVTVTPTVTISGPTAVALLGSEANTIMLTASGNPAGGTYSWSTSSSHVSLNPSGSEVNVGAVSKSSTPSDVAPVRVTYTVNSQMGTATQSITVQAATSVAVESTISNGQNTCPSGQAGWLRVVRLQLRDQFNSPILFSGISVADSISATGQNTCGITSFSTGKGTTDSSGSWTDTFDDCSTACVSGNCETDATQTWTADSVTLPNTVAVVYKCNSITINGS